MDGLSAAAGPAAASGPWTNFWKILTRFDAAKVTPALALRNATGVGVPLLVGLAAGSLLSGVAVSAGALNVAFADSYEPYSQRSRHMLRTCLLVAIAVYLGALCGSNHALDIVIATAWAFAAGMLVALGTAPADAGVISLIVLIVFSAQPLPADKAWTAGLLAFAGGLFQTALSLAFWPVQPFEPERRALGALYQELSVTLNAPLRSSVAPPASAQSTQAQISLAAPGRHSIESERYHLLLSQAERIRLSLLTLTRLRGRMDQDTPGSRESQLLDRCFAISSELLGSIGRQLLENKAIGPAQEAAELQGIAEQLRAPSPDCKPALAALARDARFQVDALAGQIRTGLDLASSATPQGRIVFEREQEQKPWRLRLGSHLAKLRANLTLRSAACRHAVRLAACVAVADAVAWTLDWRRAYWIPMTVAIVLKPDFTATFSRGVLRLTGTLIGIVLTTAVFFVLRPSGIVEIVLIMLLMFLLRCYGPANYGILAVTVTALVVLLIALATMSGTAVPTDVITARGLNTLVGGAIALIAYAAWPTWERTQIREVIAALLDAYRDYFRLVRENYLQPNPSRAAKLDRARLAGRLARSNLEASIDRLTSEPGTSPEAMSTLTAMLASSHRLANAMIALEAGVSRGKPVPPRAEFRTLANHMELTLYSLAEALRGSPLNASDLPDLREDHHALITTGDSRAERYALVNAETDRMTNSLNTLSEDVLRLVGGRAN